MVRAAQGTVAEQCTAWADSLRCPSRRSAPKLCHDRSWESLSVVHTQPGVSALGADLLPPAVSSRTRIGSSEREKGPAHKVRRATSAPVSASSRTAAGHSVTASRFVSDVQSGVQVLIRPRSAQGGTGIHSYTESTDCQLHSQGSPHGRRSPCSTYCESGRSGSGRSGSRSPDALQQVVAASVRHPSREDLAPSRSPPRGGRHNVGVCVATAVSPPGSSLTGPSPTARSVGVHGSRESVPHVSSRAREVGRCEAASSPALRPSRVSKGQDGMSATRGTSPASATSPRSSHSRSPARDDPYQLRRFAHAQKTMQAQALAEIRRGRKMTGWMYFIIPTPPYIVKGVERGSADNRRYALRSDEEVQAYLEFQADGVDLKSNYLEIMRAVRDQLRAGKHPTSLMGKLSAPKLCSSVRLFERVTKGSGDKELHMVLEELMELVTTAASIS